MEGYLFWRNPIQSSKPLYNLAKTGSYIELYNSKMAKLTNLVGLRAYP